MGDSQASLFAQRCFEPGSAKVTFGTGSSILLNVGHSMKLSQRGVLTTLAWVHRGIPTYAFEGIIISSAATLSWLRDQLGIVTSFQETEALAADLADSDGVYFVPAFSGLGLPYWQPTARAGIVGLSSHSDRRHLVRSALESIAYQLRDALDALRMEAALPLRRLHGDGGATANRWLMQFTADVTGVGLHVSTVSNCSALGAALAGFLGLDVYPSLAALADLPRGETSYQPSMPAARVQSLLLGWQNAVRQILSPFEKCLP
jgi:glycerol kinase